MLTFVALFAFASSQLLLLGQHQALMTLYTSLGCNNNTACPRFAENESCRGTAVTCSAGTVVSIDLAGLGLNGSVGTEVGSFASLTSLTLRGCGLLSVPTTLGQLSLLDTLMLTSNLLSSVPTQLGLLTALRSLGLGFNALVSLPAEIGRLTRLTALGIGGFKGAELPSNFTQMSHLDAVNARNTIFTAWPFSAAPLRSCFTERSGLNCSAINTACRSTCSARVPNDDCVTPQQILTTANFSTDGATACDFCGACDMDDVWFEHVATCTGILSVRVCGNSFRFQVLDSCPRPTAGPVPCGAHIDCAPRLDFPVTVDQRILFRVGTATTNTSAGNLTISCVPQGSTALTTAAMTSTSTSTSTTDNVAPVPVPPAPIALIAGVVGGVVALLLVGVAVALVLRRRRKTASSTMASPTTEQIYGDVQSVRVQYDDVGAVRTQTPPQHA